MCLFLFFAIVKTSFGAATVAVRNVGSQGFNNTGTTNYIRVMRNGASLGAFALAPGATSTAFPATVGGSMVIQTSWAATSWTNWSRTDVGAQYTGQVNPVVDGNNYVLDVFMGSPPDESTNTCNIVLCARNNDTKYRIFCLWKNGQYYNATNYPGGLGIGAGQIGCYEFTVACTNALGWSLAPCLGEEYAGGDYGVTNYNILTNGTGYSYPGVTNSVTPAGPTVFNPTNGQTSNIIWSVQSTTNSIISQQLGDAALYDAITKSAQQNDTNLRKVHDLLGVSSNLLMNNLFTNKQGNDIATSGFNGLSNLNMGISNALVDLKNNNTNVANAVRNFHIDNTNLLAAILNASTNQWTNTIEIATESTNEAAARAMAEGIMGTHQAEVQTALDGIGDEAPGVLSGSGSLEVLENFEFVGFSLNLNPEAQFPGIGTFFQGGIMLVLSMTLGRYLANLYKETAATYAASQTGGSPDLNMFGFNAAGPIVGFTCATIIVTLWVAVFTLLFSFAMTHLVAIRGNVDGWTTGNHVADYLLLYFFPVPFMMACGWTRIIAPMAVTKLVVLTNSIQRFLMAK